MQEPNKGGRPAIFTQELADKVCEELGTGKSMRTVCRSEGMPSMSTVFMWLRTNEKFLQQYTRAKEESADAFIEEMLDIADDSLQEARSGDSKASNAVVHAMQLRVDTRKWIASKLKPKRYGDKLDLTSDGKALPAPILGGNALPTNNSNPEDTQS